MSNTAETGFDLYTILCEFEFGDTQACYDEAGQRPVMVVMVSLPVVLYHMYGVGKCAVASAVVVLIRVTLKLQISLSSTL